MPRGKLVTKSEVRRSVPKLKPQKAVPPKAQIKAAKKQSIAKVSRTAKPAAKKPDLASPHHPSISITVRIPQLRRPKNTEISPKIATRTRTVRRLLPVLLAAVCIVVAGGLFVLPKDKHALKPVAVAEAAARNAPDYQPLMLPGDSPTNQSYDGHRNQVGFTTSFSGARVTVSEQPLPANFKTDPAALLRAAESINAKKRIDTANGSVFIASNQTAGDQMGVFAAVPVLVFIHTDHTMDDFSWKSFAEQLKPADWQPKAESSR